MLTNSINYPKSVNAQVESLWVGERMPVGERMAVGERMGVGERMAVGGRMTPTYGGVTINT